MKLGKDALGVEVNSFEYSLNYMYLGILIDVLFTPSCSPMQILALTDKYPQAQGRGCRNRKKGLLVHCMPYASIVLGC